MRKIYSGPKYLTNRLLFYFLRIILQFCPKWLLLWWLLIGKIITTKNRGLKPRWIHITFLSNDNYRSNGEGKGAAQTIVAQLLERYCWENKYENEAVNFHHEQWWFLDKYLYIIDSYLFENLNHQRSSLSIGIDWN